MRQMPVGQDNSVYTAPESYSAPWHLEGNNPANSTGKGQKARRQYVQPELLLEPHQIEAGKDVPDDFEI